MEVSDDNIISVRSLIATGFCPQKHDARYIVDENGKVRKMFITSVIHNVQLDQLVDRTFVDGEDCFKTEEEAKKHVFVAQGIPECDRKLDIVLHSVTPKKKGATTTYTRVILPNVSAQIYTFGSVYPGVIEGEEFVFCNYKKGLVFPRHCMISVDNKGQYWINNNNVMSSPEEESLANLNKKKKKTKKFPATYINSVKLEGSRVLEIGDMISLGNPDTICTLGRPRPVFHVERREFTTMNNNEETFKLTKKKKGDEKNTPLILLTEENPFQNHLIIGLIQSYLPIQDVKTSRLISKQWNTEATKVLSKRGKLVLEFGTTYMNPETSTKVFRYIQEVQTLKIRQIFITLKTTAWINGLAINSDCETPLVQSPVKFSEGAIGCKMTDDIQKFVNSVSTHCSSLCVKGSISCEKDFLLFHSIIERMGENLTDLSLFQHILYLPDQLPQFESLRSLKKLSDHFTSSVWRVEDDGPLMLKIRLLITRLVTMFANSLEEFSCSSSTAFMYLPIFLTNNVSNLHVIRIGVDADGKGSLSAVSSEILGLLLQLTDRNNRSFLSQLELSSPQNISLYEQLVCANSATLKKLVLVVRKQSYPSYANGGGNVYISFPRLPILETFKLVYGSTTRINWNSNNNNNNGTTFINYEKSLPALRKLEIEPTETFDWEKEEDVFNTFFPFNNNTRVLSTTVTSITVPTLTNPNSLENWRYPRKRFGQMQAQFLKFQSMLSNIETIFPKVQKLLTKDVGLEFSYPRC